MNQSSFVRTELNGFKYCYSTLIVLAGYPDCVLVNAMVCGIVVSEFGLQSCYYVPFWTDIFGQGMNPIILPAMG